MRVDDPAMLDAELVKLGAPRFKLRSVRASERDMVETSAMLVERPACPASRVSVQAEELPAGKLENRVVKTAPRLVFVKHGVRTQQSGVPASAAVEIRHGDRHMSDRREGSHGNPPHPAISTVNVPVSRLSTTARHVRLPPWWNSDATQRALDGRESGGGKPLASSRSAGPYWRHGIHD